MEKVIKEVMGGVFFEKGRILVMRRAPFMSCPEAGSSPEANWRPEKRRSSVWPASFGKSCALKRRSGNISRKTVMITTSASCISACTGCFPGRARLRSRCMTTCAGFPCRSLPSFRACFLRMFLWPARWKRSSALPQKTRGGCPECFPEAVGVPCFIEVDGDRRGAGPAERAFCDRGTFA